MTKQPIMTVLACVKVLVGGILEVRKFRGLSALISGFALPAHQQC